MIKIVIPILFFLVINPLYAEIYKWTDNQGVVHFSDEPHPGAQQVVLPPTQTTSPQPKTVTPAATSTSSNPLSTPHEYKIISITQPKSEETIRNNQGFLSVVVDINPEIQAGDMLQLLFDGQPLGKPQSGKVFTLNNINRGTHTLAVQVLDDDGSVLNTSETIAFHMQRPRVGMVPQTRPTNTP